MGFGGTGMLDVGDGVAVGLDVCKMIRIAVSSRVIKITLRYSKLEGDKTKQSCTLTSVFSQLDELLINSDEEKYDDEKKHAIKQRGVLNPQGKYVVDRI